MTVSIDPSEVRRQTAAPEDAERTALRLPVRTLLLVGLGGASLLAFAYGASSFFSGLADPRVRPRLTPVAANWPDLKDGLPALASENGAPARPPAATVLNLPRPAQTEPDPTATVESKPASRGLSNGAIDASAVAPRAEPAAAPAPPAGTARAAETAPIEKPAPLARTVGPAAREPAPPIENAPTIKVEARATLVPPARAAISLPPAKAETVRARAAEPGTFASLSPVPTKSEPSRRETQRAEAARPEPAMPTARRKPVQSATAKPPALRPVLEASAASPAEAAPRPAPAKVSEDSEVMGVKIPGSRHIRDGWKAVFGGDS